MNYNRRNQKQRRGYRLASQNSYSNFENPSISWIEPHKYVTFKYTEVFSSSVVSAGGAQQTMNLNSIFDPNRTGAGHQPYGYDQLAALYNRYRVLKTQWKVTFGTQSGTYNLVVFPVNGLIASSVAGASTFQTACELPFAVHRTQGGGGAPTIVIDGEIELNKLNGCTRAEYLGDDRFEAQVGASPTELMTLGIGLYNPTTATVDINYTVEIIYYTDLHDPISIAGS